MFSKGEWFGAWGCTNKCEAICYTITKFMAYGNGVGGVLADTTNLYEHKTNA